MIDPNFLYRAVVLNVANNRGVQKLVTTRDRSSAQRFVAGAEVEDALAAIDALEADGIHGILDLLGEMVTSQADVEAFTSHIEDQIDAFATRSYPRYVSIKLSQLGFDLDFERMMVAVRRIVEKARAQDCFIRIDMEDSPRVDRTFEAYRMLRESGLDNVGLVLQSYLRRSSGDLESLLELSPNLRIVKGAYKELPSAAFQDKAKVDAEYVTLARTNLRAGNRTALATHDERIIDEMQAWLRREEIDPDLVEFQMLYGVRRDLQRKLAASGHRVRAYVPFGTDWYPYFSRRIAERPANALFIAKAMFKG